MRDGARSESPGTRLGGFKQSGTGRASSAPSRTTTPRSSRTSSSRRP